MAVNVQKFLPPSKSGALAKITAKQSSVSISERSQENLGIIKVKSIEVDKLLKGTLAIEKKQLDEKKKKDTQKRRDDIEQKLETKPKVEKGSIKMPSLPRMGFLDWIKNFIGNIVLGYFAVRLVDHLPKLIPIAKLIGKATDFAIDLGGKLLDGLATFVDVGYKAVDATRNLVGKTFGDDALKNFDLLTSEFEKFMNLAIIVGLASADFGMSRLKGKGTEKELGKRGVGKASTRVGGKSAGKLTSKIGTKALKAIPLLGAGLSIAEGIMRIREGDYVGGLLSFGTAIPVAGWAFLALDVAREFMGGREFDKSVGKAFGGTSGLTDKQVQKKSPSISGPSFMGLAGGGITRGGKNQRRPSRTIRKGRRGKYKRVVPKKPGEVEITSPGSDVGGEDKLFGLFPNPLKMAQNAVDMMNPFKVIEKAGKNLGDSDYFGPILAITSKILLGQKPSQTDYKNVGLGINLLIAKGIDDGKIKGGLAAAFAGGGFVDPSTLNAISEGGDISDWVASSFKEATETNAQKTLREIQNNLRLKSTKTEKDEQLQKYDQNLTPGEPGVTVTGGNADFWTLVAIASLESGNPQGRADVAQSIYNRLASGIYGGRTIKELIVSGNGRQYQPVGRAVKEFRAISDKESAINAVMVANKLNRSQAEKFINDTASAIQNKDLQKNAAAFVGGRTDFWAEGLTPPSSGVGYVVRHGHRFGWFVGPAAIAYGKKNPGPAKAPQLGDVVVMGGYMPDISLGKGYGSAGSKIAGELGRYIKKRLRQGPDFSQVHRHPEHPPYSLTSGHSRGSLHYQGRAIDIGAYTNEQGKILKVIDEFNKMKGVKPVQLLHGKNEPRGHSDHVHVAYEKGGMTKPYPHVAMIGEKGREFVIDADSTAAIEGTFPGFLDAINKAKYSDAIQVLKNYASYESDSNQTVVIMEPPVNIISGGEGAESSPSILFAGAEEEDPFDFLYASS